MGREKEHETRVWLVHPALEKASFAEGVAWTSDPAGERCRTSTWEPHSSLDYSAGCCLRSLDRVPAGAETAGQDQLPLVLQEDGSWKAASEPC